MAGVATSRRLQLVIILNVLLALQFPGYNVVHGHSGALTIPSLGRTSEIGNLYDERKDEFTEHYIFASGKPILSHVTSEVSNNKIQKSAVFQNFSDKFKFFELDLSTAVNIIFGLVRPTGSGEILLTNGNGSITRGIFMTTIDTVKENLQIFSPTFRQFISPGSTNIEGATHVVSGIRWGGRLAIEFQSNSRSDLKEEAKLFNYFEKLMRPPQNASEIRDEDRPINMVAHSDFTLSSTPLNNLSQAHDLLQRMPSSLQQHSAGKGLPLEYTLTPLSILREYLGEPARTGTSLVYYPAPDYFLRDVINIFDDIYKVREDVDNVISEVSSVGPSNCNNPAAINELRSLKMSFEEEISQLTRNLNSALFQFRSGEVRGSSSLFDVLKSFKESDYSHTNVPHLLAELEPERERVRFCSNLESSYSDVLYIGRGEELVPVFNHTMYVLYKKQALIEEGRGVWQENLHTFLEVLNTPNSSRIVVDCDLAATEECKDLNWTTIRQIRNVTVTMENVVHELKTETCLPNGQSVFNLCKLNECQNEALCSPSADYTDFVCTCPSGFIGKTCDTKVEECWTDGRSCSNRGRCEPSEGDSSHFGCTCSPGYEGQHCETDRDDCAADACSNDGTCVDGVDSYSCTCAPGFTGRTCEGNVDDCGDPSPCLHGGTCHDKVNSYTCVCAPGYEGTVCERDQDDCAGRSLCLNGGSCVDALDNYSCLCRPGFAGSNCELNVDDCAGHRLCLNGGSCRDGENTYRCVCAGGYEGPNCEVNIDDCAGGSRCRNGGTCVDGVQTYTCYCPPGYAGRDCTSNVDECVGHPCRNGGTCVDQINGFSCTCPPKFHGAICEYDSCMKDFAKAAEVKDGRDGATSTGCGGNVYFPRFPDYPSSFLFEYKSAQRFSDKRKCVWTIGGISNGVTYKLDAQVTLLCLGNSNKGAAVSVLNRNFSDTDDFVLYNQQLRDVGDSYKTSWWDHKLFLSYTSSGTPGYGFVVKVELLSRTSNLYGVDYNYASGFFSSRTYVFKDIPRQHNTVVLNPQQLSTKFRVNFASKKTEGKCEYWDTLKVYEIVTTATYPFRLATMCYTSSFGSANLQNPILAAIRTSRYVEVTKMEITWE